MDNTTVGILVSILAIFVTLFIYFLFRKSKAEANEILLTGISNSGKTLMYCFLTQNKFVKTHTSIKENVAPYHTDEGYRDIIDIPGDERLRYKFLDQYKKMAKAIVFVIDSSTFQKDMRDVAEYLYALMSDPVIVETCQEVMIFCNKQDLQLCKGAEFIKNQLEKEINVLRNTQAHQLDSIEGNQRKSVYLGSENSDFDFSQYPATVSCIEGYVYSESASPESNLDELEEWICNL